MDFNFPAEKRIQYHSVLALFEILKSLRLPPTLRASRPCVKPAPNSAYTASSAVSEGGEIRRNTLISHISQITFHLRSVKFVKSVRFAGFQTGSIRFNARGPTLIT